jgi:hypothetical protein
MQSRYLLQHIKPFWEVYQLLKKKSRRGCPKSRAAPWLWSGSGSGIVLPGMPQSVQELLAGIELLVLGLALFLPLLAIFFALGKAYDLVAHNDALELVFIGTIGCARSGIGNHA